MDGEQDGKVILFPNLVESLLRRAVKAKEEKRFEEAQGHLLSILQISPRHPAALLTLALILYDARCFEEAAELYSYMWAEGIGRRREWLRLYLSCLIQLEDYEAIRDVLKKASQEEEFHDVIDQLKEITEACDLYQDCGEDHRFSRDSVLLKLDADPDYPGILQNNLFTGNFEEQLYSIEQLKHIHTNQTVEALKKYLLMEGPDPILKTFALRSLREMGEQGEINIHKFGKYHHTRIEDVPLRDTEVPETEWQVIERVTQVADKHNASFLPFAFQLWMEYLFSIFPLHPTVRNPSGWAAALHYATSKLLFLDESQKDVAKIYGVSVSLVARNYKNLNDILSLEARIR